MKTLALGFLLFTSHLAHAAALDCALLAGSYPSLDFRHQNLEIAYNPATSTLTISHDTASQGRGWTEMYLADGQEHPGDDLNTGKTYTAHCEPGLIQIERDFRQLVTKMKTEIKKEEGVVTQTDTIGSSSSVFGRFKAN